MILEKSGQLPSTHPIQWTENHRWALNILIDCITSPPILAYPDYKSSFIVHTDASQSGLGAVLYQHQGEILRVIACTHTSGKELSSACREVRVSCPEMFPSNFEITCTTHHRLQSIRTITH